MPLPYLTPELFWSVLQFSTKCRRALKPADVNRRVHKRSEVSEFHSCLEGCKTKHRCKWLGLYFVHIREVQGSIPGPDSSPPNKCSFGFVTPSRHVLG